MTPVRVGVVGLGFMGRVHLGAYRRAEEDGLEVRLSGVCDRSADRLTGRASAAGNLGDADNEMLFDPREVRTCQDPDELFAADDLDLVSICTHTDSHVELATRAMQHGKHVLLEKPIALSSHAIEPLATQSRESGVLCMPAMCMRFWPAWKWLRDVIASAELGPVISARFERIGSRPDWTSFYQDTSRSGSALVDLHIHDTDFVAYCFGSPRAVRTVGDDAHVSTLYLFDGSPAHVTAEGGWLPSMPFGMRYRVVFEGATADFELGRAQELLLHTPDGSDEVRLPGGDGYDGEVRHLLQAITECHTAIEPSLSDAAQVMRMIEAEQRSLASGKDEQILPD